MASQLLGTLFETLFLCSSLISLISFFNGYISFWLMEANPARSLLSSSTRSLEFSFFSPFVVNVGASILLSLFCLLGDGFCTSSGLLKEGHK